MKASNVPGRKPIATGYVHFPAVQRCAPGRSYIRRSQAVLLGRHAGNTVPHRTVHQILHCEMEWLRRSLNLCA
jgi:hypothetical protein